MRSAMGFTTPNLCDLEFGHFLSVNLGELQAPSLFTEIFRRQMVTLQQIEEDDGMNSEVHSQVVSFPPFP